MNYCINCAWRDKQFLRIDPHCTLPGVVDPNPVTGYVEYPLCWKARWPGTRCGAEGKCWELKPTFWQMFTARFKA